MEGAEQVSEPVAPKRLSFSSFEWFERKRHRGPSNGVDELSKIFPEDEEEGVESSAKRFKRNQSRRFGRRVFKRPRTPPPVVKPTMANRVPTPPLVLAQDSTLNEKLYVAREKAKKAIGNPQFSPLGSSVDLVADLRVSFTIHLYIDGYTKVDAVPPNGSQAAQKPPLRYPYNRHSRDFLLALDLGLIPPREDLPDPGSCSYVAGCLVAELHDHRSNTAIRSRKILLRPDGLSIVNDINHLDVASEGEEFVGLFVESDILRVTKRVDLRPFDAERFHRYGYRSSTKLNICRMPGFAKRLSEARIPLTSQALVLVAGANGLRNPWRKIRPENRIALSSPRPTGREISAPYGKDLPVPVKLNELSLKPYAENGSRIRLVRLHARTTNPMTGAPTEHYYQLELNFRQKKGCECTIQRGPEKPVDGIKRSFGSVRDGHRFVDQMKKIKKADGFAIMLDTNDMDAAAMAQKLRRSSVSAGRGSDGGPRTTVGSNVVQQQRTAQEMQMQNAQQRGMPRAAPNPATFANTMPRAAISRAALTVNSSTGLMAGNQGFQDSQRQQSQNPQQNARSQQGRQQEMQKFLPQAYQMQQSQRQQQMQPQSQGQQQQQRHAQAQQMSNSTQQGLVQQQQMARTWNGKQFKREPGTVTGPGAANSSVQGGYARPGVQNAGNSGAPISMRGKWTNQRTTGPISPPQGSGSMQRK
ncbi:hypothetical protein NDN08_005244 [Rhodosorus marinus]|uniref:Spt20-like SEP domain-containing protein n=1 Tax=Rhodosorus marinus TaxID=101924 RepID=A0AAV8V104_9RHOD|nr:hypothetical protein NDN08_005244 [Rhodosorus marinus]